MDHQLCDGTCESLNSDGVSDKCKALYTEGVCTSTLNNQNYRQYCPNKCPGKY